MQNPSDRLPYLRGYVGRGIKYALEFIEEARTEDHPAAREQYLAMARRCLEDCARELSDTTTPYPNPE